LYYAKDRPVLKRQLLNECKKYNEKNSFEFDKTQVFQNSESFKVEILPGYFEKYYINGKNTGSKGGIRSDIHEFSRKSRSRLKEYLIRLDYKSCIFATLTIQNKDLRIGQDDYRRIIANFKNYNLRSSRWPMVVKLEFHKSGIPHLHIFAFNVLGNIFDFKRDLTNMWLRAVNYVLADKVDIEVMRNTCSRVDRVHNDIAFFGYIANYTSGKKANKEYQNEFPEGWKNVRFWYKWCMDSIPKKDTYTVVLSPSNYFEMIKKACDDAGLDNTLRQGIIYQPH